jgi:hypothetical protein
MNNSQQLGAFFFGHNPAFYSYSLQIFSCTVLSFIFSGFKLKGCSQSLEEILFGLNVLLVSCFNLFL